MALFDIGRPAQSGGAFGRLNTTLVTAIGGISAWNDTRVTRNALKALSDRELNDIGLARGDIDAVKNR